MDNKTITRVILFGMLAIIGIIAAQTYWVVNTWDLKEDEFHQTVNVALLKVANDLAKNDSISLPIQDLVIRRSSNYYIVNINNNIDAASLEHYLIREFEAHALNIAFEYAIFDCASNAMVYGNYCDLSDEDEIRKESSGYFPKDEELIYYFGVKFPGRSSYLGSKMQLSIFFTVILLVTILFFIFSIFIIINQKRLSESQKDFINNMTHEFKTPISTIKISADVFAQHPLIKEDERLSKYATIIQQQNDRLNKQVEKVLQLAKVERHNFQLQQEIVDLHPLIRSIIHTNETRINEISGSLKGIFCKGNPKIRADVLHLNNILNNLLDNAIKYCEDAPKIIIETHIFNKKIEISIKDNGIGISKEHQKKVFNKFFRVPTGNIHNVKGFGLGLFYVKNICDAHHWPITVKSEVDEGTEFKIYIPIV